MITHKLLFSLIVILSFPNFGMAQGLKANLLIWTPQIVYYNFNQENISINPIMSIGAGLSHKSKFIELAAFIRVCFFLNYSFNWGAIGIPLCVNRI